MAVPQRKTSRSRTRSRRARWKAHVPALVRVDVGGGYVLVPPHLAHAARRGLIERRVLVEPG